MAFVDNPHFGYLEQSAAELSECDVKPLGVVVLAYNRCDFTRRTVSSMLDHTAGLADIIVADNASCDETPSLATFFGKAVRYVRFEENLAADAVNRLWAHMPHAYLMRSDNDLDYKADWDRRLIAVLRNTAGLGGLTPMKKHFETEEEQRRALFTVAGEPAWYVPGTVTGTIAIPRTLYERGLRWRTGFPVNDSPFCLAIRALGHTIATIDAAGNFGFSRFAMDRYEDYYRENFRNKSAAGAFGPGEEARYLDKFTK